MTERCALCQKVHRTQAESSGVAQGLLVAVLQEIRQRDRRISAFWRDRIQKFVDEEEEIDREHRRVCDMLHEHIKPGVPS